MQFYFAIDLYIGEDKCSFILLLICILEKINAVFFAIDLYIGEDQCSLIFLFESYIGEDQGCYVLILIYLLEKNNTRSVYFLHDVLFCLIYTLY